MALAVAWIDEILTRENSLEGTEILQERAGAA